jgi:hypothetical protein
MTTALQVAQSQGHGRARGLMLVGVLAVAVMLLVHSLSGRAVEGEQPTHPMTGATLSALHGAISTTTSGDELPPGF